MVHSITPQTLAELSCPLLHAHFVFSFSMEWVRSMRQNEIPIPIDQLPSDDEMRMYIATYCNV